MPDMEFCPLETDFSEANYQRTPYGPSSKSICRVLNSGSCGSGTVVGKRDGKTLVLTNAHVAGTKIGHTVVCEFPGLGNNNHNAKVIMAAYSDRVMMDWAVLQVASDLPLTPTKLSKEAPSGEHYTGGYPRCQGPYYQKLATRGFTHSGTVWRWQPISIGGQSGSGVHSFADNLYYGLLTWSWGGDGAGQTCKSIWLQYSQRATIGFIRPEGLIELADNRAADLEEGFFSEANITELPIWAHLDEPDEPEPTPPSGDLAKAVLQYIDESQKSLAKLREAAESGSADGSDSPPSEPGGGSTFGL